MLKRLRGSGGAFTPIAESATIASASRLSCQADHQSEWSQA